ncbi:MAG: rhodanese-like domain-containing protein [Verrucomicrobiales bacterium]|nr:rhodanese-like domain-containing protein [Verrucomicrobiales bacterium]
MISTKFKIILAVILIFGLLALFASHRWYKTLDNYTSLDNYGDFLKKEFPSVEHISTDSLATLLRARDAGVGTMALIDCRTPEEYEASHLAGAKNIETAEAVDAWLKLNDAESVIVYCAVGYRSAKLAEELQETGYENVKNVVGSIFSWANEDRPLVDSAGNPVEKVHPYNQFWRRHLKEGKAIPLPSGK